MDALFEALCYLLDDELERQENILALCQAQGEAARRHDIEYLEARTGSLAPLLQETAQSEILRQRLIEQIASQATLSGGPPTLTQLISVANEPWSSRLRHFQTRFQETLGRTRAVVQSNAPVLRASLHVISQAVRTLERCAWPEGAAYTAAGVGPAKANAQPTLIDRRG
jgi:hypothetical protein